MSNITLIGMPGSGKSTVGVLLAKTLGRGFLDTDLVIQQQENALLQDILDRRGVTARDLDGTPPEETAEEDQETATV